MKVEMQLRGMDGVLKTLNSLPAEIVSKRGGPAKLSLAKGARFLRDRYKEKLHAAIQGGKTTNSAGELEKRVIASRGKAPTSGKGERYLVRIKKRDYVNANGERTNPLMVMNLIEYGSSHQPATPVARPTAQQHGAQAITIVTEDLAKRVDKVVATLAAQNKGG